MNSSFSPDIEEEISSETLDDIEEPSMYKVLLHNDDYTEMEFVVEILMLVFNKSLESATEIMLKIHARGIGLCGVYTYDVAETKVDTVHALSREHEFPLRCTIEEE